MGVEPQRKESLYQRKKGQIQTVLLVIGYVTLLMLGGILLYKTALDFLPWVEGTDRGGDMKQHFTAARMLHDESSFKTLYHDFHWSREVIRFFDAQGYQKGLTADDHNYRYPPMVAWISTRFIAIPYNGWLILWFIAMSGFLALSAKILWEMERLQALPLNSRLIIGAYFLSFFPLLYGIALYQNNLLTFLIFICACKLVHDHEYLTGGLIFGLIAVYKPQLVPYIGIISLLFGLWPFCLGAALSSILVTLAGIVVCGVESHEFWIKSVIEVIEGVQGDEMETNIPWKGFILTLTPEPIHTPAIIAARIVSVVFLGLFVVLQFHRPSWWQAEYALYLAATWWLIFTEHVKPYEMILATPLWIVMIQRKPGLRKYLMLTGFWVAGTIAVTSRLWDASFTAPLMTLFLIGFLRTSFKKSQRPQNYNIQNAPVEAEDTDTLEPASTGYLPPKNPHRSSQTQKVRKKKTSSRLRRLAEKPFEVSDKDDTTESDNTYENVEKSPKE